MIDNEHVRQIVAFNSVVGGVGSSGKCINQTAVAASLGLGSILGANCVSMIRLQIEVVTLVVIEAQQKS